MSRTMQESGRHGRRARSALWMQQKLQNTKQSDSAWMWLSTFFEKALVRRVNRRVVKLWRSTCEVLIVPVRVGRRV
jgi:hypothetical protein